MTTNPTIPGDGQRIADLERRVADLAALVGQLVTGALAPGTPAESLEMTGQALITAFGIGRAFERGELPAASVPRPRHLRAVSGGTS